MAFGWYRGERHELVAASFNGVKPWFFDDECASLHGHHEVVLVKVGSTIRIVKTSRHGDIMTQSDLMKLFAMGQFRCRETDVEFFLSCVSVLKNGQVLFFWTDSKSDVSILDWQFLKMIKLKGVERQTGGDVNYDSESLIWTSHVTCFELKKAVHVVREQVVALLDGLLGEVMEGLVQVTDVD